MYTADTSYGKLRIKGFVKETNSPVRDFISRLNTSSNAKLGMLIIGITIILALVAEFIAPYNPTLGFGYMNYRGQGELIPPCFYHPFGTNNRGDDVFSQIIYGTRISLLIGVVAVAVASTIGIVIGASAGYFGGKVDDILMRFTDINIIMPDFFVLLMIMALFGSSIWNIMIVIGLLSWEGLARLVRAEFLSLREREFVEAARALGASDRTIIFKHILPNAMSPVIVSIALRISGAILTESSLSFLGLGDNTIISWGGMLTRANEDLVQGRFWIPTFPGLAIFLVVIAFNMIGDGVRDAIDPKMKNKGMKMPTSK